MALLENCFCCSLNIAAGFLAVYLLISYLIAFGFELLWILESEISLPTAAVLLCAGYFTIAIFAALLIHGIATRNGMCLLCWLFAVTITIFPETGLVIYMSIQYWSIETQFGITELICWMMRSAASLTEFLVVHSLYSLWKEEELIAKRIHDLNMVIPIPREASLNSLNTISAYQNNAFDNSLEQYDGLKRAVSMQNVWNEGIPNNLTSIPYDGYQFYTTQSEFNASVFVPNYYPNQVDYKLPSKKAQSLMDLRTIDDDLQIDEKISKQWQPWMSRSIETSSVIVPPAKCNSDFNKRLSKCASVDALNEINKEHHIIKNRSGFYAQPLPNYGVPIYYGPLDGPDFLIYRKQIDKLNSKNSLSNTSMDDVQKYRDVAL